MSQELKCLKNSETNAYIIPTNKWLQPIKPLITNSSDATNIISRMVDKEKILVRLTNNKNNKQSLFNFISSNKIFTIVSSWNCG